MEEVLMQFEVQQKPQRKLKRGLKILKGTGEPLFELLKGLHEK